MIMVPCNTPKRIDDTVKQFCKSIAPNSKPKYIRVCPETWCKQNDCYNNVMQKVAESGGKRQLGWRIQAVIDPLPKYMIEAVHHAIWITEDGERIDITPQPNAGNRIVFLPDDSINLEEYRIGEIYQALFDWPEVIEYIRLCNLESTEYINKTKLNEQPQIPQNLLTKQDFYLQKIINRCRKENLFDLSQIYL